MISYNKALSYLKLLNPMGIRLGLEQITALLARLGNPQDAYPSVIIAGTNGKGSVAAMIASILSVAGFKTGLYTSPDLIDFRERIRINGKMIAPKEVINCLEIVRKNVTETVSYFEFITAMAFLHFQRQKIDIAVLEVGMGGRLDATNVANALVSVVTNISREHEEYLGRTLEKIAYEKGGVIKEKGICITAAKQKSVVETLKGICEKRNAKLYRLGKELRTSAHRDGTFSYTGETKQFKRMKSPFIGRHQIANAALALGVIETLAARAFPIRDSDVRRGLERAKWEGRIEIVQRSPMLLLDGAHNPAGVATLCLALKNDFVYKRLILIFGVMGDKNYRLMAKRLFPLADSVIITCPPSERALSPKILSPIALEFNKNTEIIVSPGDALRHAFELAGDGDLICVAGSLYLVGEIKKAYKNITVPLRNERR
jgi:dihydrofolate synthase/folylpolyglutamate synthase